MNLLDIDPDKMYLHGSTHDITEFSKDMANPEGHFGAGFYFTSDVGDVNQHYAGFGPDLTNRIQQRAEQLASELDLDYDDPEVIKRATEEIAGQSQGAIYPIRLRTQRPFDITSEGDTFLEYRGPELDPEDYRDEAMNDIFEYDYDSVADYEEALRERMDDLAFEDSMNFEPEGPLVDFIESIRRNEFVDQDQAEELIAKIQEEAYDGGIDAKRLDKIFRDTPLYAEDDMGRLVDNEVYRQAIEDAGFDSIVHDANIFRGMDVPEGTKHTIVFEPNQIRSDYAEFDPEMRESGNILASPAPVGVVGGLLATEAVTPEGQLNPLLAVPAEVGSALNEAVVGTLDFIGPDTVNAISQLAGSDFRVPRLSDQDLVKMYTQGGYMDEGYGRDFVRTATGLLQPF